MRGEMLGAPETRERSGRPVRRVIRIILLILILATVGIVAFEATTSTWQSRYFAQVASEMTYRVEPEPSDSVHFPVHGPYDERLGYISMPQMLDSLQSLGFRITAQARISPAMAHWAARNVGPIYEEKTQAGLTVLDRAGRLLYRSRYPRRVYAEFDSIPEVVVNTLLFIENRELLQTEHPRRNPAVEWDRLARAAFDGLRGTLDGSHKPAGGSTLATQVEKFRHAPGGWTASPKDKLRQMFTASLRAYRDGRDTSEERRRIFLDYLNTIPLAAAPGQGEVAGLGDGLWAWYSTDLEDVTRLLQGNSAPAPRAAGVGEAAAAVPGVEEIAAEPIETGGEVLDEGLAYRRVLSLLIAQRRPTAFLLRSPQTLAELTDSYLRILAREGVIDATLRDSALRADRGLAIADAPMGASRDGSRGAPEYSPVSWKAALSIRSTLVSLLGRRDLYDLDRLDIAAHATLDSVSQRRTLELFQELRNPAFVREKGLLAPRLLPEDDLQSVVYSVTLYERTPGGNLLRVQADTFEGALNVNERGRLELGSTAKLRTLTTYLEIIAGEFQTLRGLPPQDLAALKPHPKDMLGRWTLEYVRTHREATLAECLEAAMTRTYSANPGERFFTGGGLHTFSNFDRKHDNSVVTVRTAFRQSINLPFIRIMRDVVQHYTYRRGGPAAKFLEDTGDTLRQVYLERFADREGSEFLRRFYRTYRDIPVSERHNVFFDGVPASARPLSAAFRTLFPEAGPADLGSFLRARLPERSISESRVQELYRDLDPTRYSLEELGFLSRVHPLDLWLVGYLAEFPEATVSHVLEASREQRREVYRWLFRTKRKNAQDARIRVLLEVEAFLEVQRSWARLGYPFTNLVPSFATAIGSSGDRPAALADLVGIIVGGGVRQTNMRVIDLDFAVDTPYETRLSRTPVRGIQVMDPTVATVLQDALVGVVAEGTARRASGAVTLADGTVVPIGGKTGTGDNRFKVFGPQGRIIESKAINRTASFVFSIGDRFYGSIVAYVPGTDAQRFAFTSALPVQIFAIWAPMLEPLLAAPPQEWTEGSASGVTG